MLGKCLFCEQEKELQDSHVISKFVYDWLKESSATGHLRSGITPNRRVQDGYKDYLFCIDCEKLFAPFEKKFCEEIFKPLNKSKGQTNRFTYNNWLINFSISISWRVLKYLQYMGDLDEYPANIKLSINNALDTWKLFLKDENNSIGKYEQHMFFMDLIDQWNGPDLPPNINRYILRSIGMDVAYTNTTAYVYTKMCRVFLIGFIEIPHPEQWIGTKIQNNTGTIGGNCKLPIELGNFIFYQAGREADVLKSTSKKQWDKIDKSYRKNQVSAINSETWDAMSHDVKMFGDKAFKFTQCNKDKNDKGNNT